MGRQPGPIRLGQFLGAEPEPALGMQFFEPKLFRFLEIYLM
jgi:hypothetical protein